MKIDHFFYAQFFIFHVQFMFFYFLKVKNRMVCGSFFYFLYESVIKILCFIAKFRF